MDFSFISCYYIIINIAAFLLYGYDKNQSRNRGWRVSEKALLGIAFFGGFIGSYLGMQKFRHKTKHGYFYAVVGLSAILHIALWFYIF